MKCKILHETPGRMRARLFTGRSATSDCTKARMTLEEADLLEYSLKSVDGIGDVKVFDRTGDVIVRYTCSRETVIRFSRQIVRFLRSQGVKAIVIACNTASSFALETLARESDIPVIGVIYAGALTAARTTKNGCVGVIGTRGTVKSRIYEQVIRSLNPEVRVIQKACPLFVPLVEEGLIHDSVTDEIASRYLQELKGKYVDTLVLGCTHYPLLRSTIAKIMGDEVTLVNPAYETAVELKEILGREKLLNPGQVQADAAPSDGEQYRFFVSDLAESFTDFAASILPGRVKNAQKIEIEEY